MPEVNRLSITTSHAVAPTFVQELISFMLARGWSYTGGQLDKVGHTHTIRFKRPEPEVVP